MLGASIRSVPCTEGHWPFPPVRVAAPIEIQRPEWFTASVGERRSFLSMRDVMAYEAEFLAWTPTRPVPEVCFSAAWFGHRDAEAAADDELRGAA